MLLGVPTTAGFGVSLVVVNFTVYSLLPYALGRGAALDASGSTAAAVSGVLSSAAASLLRCPANCLPGSVPNC